MGSAELYVDDVQLTPQTPGLLAERDPKAAASSAAGAPAVPARVPETLKEAGLVFWVSPGADPAGTFREIVSGAAGENRGAAIGTEGDRKFLEFRKGRVDYQLSPAAAAITTSGAVCVWIKVEDATQWGGILTRGDGPSDDFSVWVDNGRFAAWFNYPLTAPHRAGEGKGYFYSKSALAVGRWTFCCAVWDGKSVTIYINGVKDNAYPYAGHPLARSRVVTLGANPPGSTNEYFVGALGSAMIFSHALSEAEIRELFANPGLKAK